jgi:catechol-2,3-dioxygenase
VKLDWRDGPLRQSRRERSALSRDPDGNGVELYWDRPRKQWLRKPDGGLAIFTRALDLDVLFKEK